MNTRILSAIFLGCVAVSRIFAADTPEAVAKQMYAAFGSGDLQRIEDLIAPDALWTMHGPSEIIPYAGTYRGSAGVRQFFADVSATITVDEHERRSFVSQGDVVHVFGRERSTVKATGGQFEANWVHMLTVRDGKIVHFEEVIDSGAVIQALAPADPERGRAFYSTCAACHGDAGEGNRFMNAPNLTRLDSVYMLRQLRHFAKEIRGGVSDFYGWQMNGRAKALVSDRAMRDVTAYIQTLPDSRSVAKIKGNAKRGESLYAPCAACHGAGGEGSVQMQSPALRGLDDWYLVRQLENYRKGTRGQHVADTAGAQMRPFALALPDAQALSDVALYITTFE